MARMRTFTFIDGDKTETKEAISFKKAVKSYQGGTKSKSVIVEWTGKRGHEYTITQALPMCRKKKLGR